MCLDANAGARAAARQRKKEKDAVFKQKALQFFNKETTFERVMDRNVLGYSRAEADAKSRALKLQGRGRRIKQDAVAKYFRTKQVNEGGRSRKYGKAQYQALLQQEAKIDNAINRAFGADLAYAQTANQRQFLAANARAREQLGVPSSYGAPVMLPPTNYLGGALQVASSVASIVSAFPTSDINLKENIKEITTSPQGHKIYEFNYIGDTTRYRGVMAQDVVKINPMAVHIQNGTLAVDYSKIDVNMELV